MVLACAGAAMAPLAVGCMGEGTTCPPLAAPTDASPDGPKDSGGVDADAEASAPSGPALAGLRLANLSPDSPQVDFCVAQSGTTAFQGPLLAQRAAALADAGQPVEAGTMGLAYPQFSAYMTLPPQQYAVRIVAGGSVDCSVPILPMDLTSLPTLGAGGVATVALIGEMQAMPKTLKVIGLRDDGTQPVAAGGSPKLYLRFLHAAPGLPEVNVSLDTVGNGSPREVFPSVAFGTVSAAPTSGNAGLTIDKNGYLSTGSLSHSAMAVTTSGDAGGAQSVSGHVTATAGAVLTVVLVGDTSSDAGTGVPLQLVECVDNGGTAGLFADCSVLQ
jgi:hypothetical protein